MRKKINLFLTIILVIAIAQFNMESTVKGKSIQSNIASGVYHPATLLNAQNLRQLPVPNTREDYAFYQAIDNVSNIVIGKFQTGERVITLISDTGTYDEKKRKLSSKPDGKVDVVAQWFVDLKRLTRLPTSDKYYDTENFAKMKDEILNGKGDTLSPNPEGIPYLKSLLKIPSNIRKVKHGFRVSQTDSDQKRERVNYFYSYRETTGAEIAFQVKYHQRGRTMVSPIINYGAYCKQSKDPYAIETAKKLIQETLKYYQDHFYD